MAYWVTPFIIHGESQLSQQHKSKNLTKNVSRLTSWQLDKKTWLSVLTNGISVCWLCGPRSKEYRWFQPMGGDGEQDQGPSLTVPRLDLKMRRCEKCACAGLVLGKSMEHFLGRSRYHDTTPRHHCTMIMSPYHWIIINPTLGRGFQSSPL